MKWNEESWMRGQQICPFIIHFNMWTLSSDVSIQRRHRQQLSVHLWAYRTHPTHEVNDVWRLTTTPGSTSPSLFAQWCRFFYVPQEPDRCKCCETGPTVHIQKWAFIWRSAKKVLQVWKRRAYCVTFTTTFSFSIAITTTDNHGSNFGYNGHDK